MTIDIQTLVAGAIVALCAVYVVRSWVRAWQGKGTSTSHGGCGGCAARTGCGDGDRSP